MKKKYIAIFSILLAVTVAVIAIWKNTNKVGKFDLHDYADIVASFSSDRVLGTIDSAKDAKEKAEVLWVEIYGEQVREEKPYGVSYDQASKTWLVQGYIPSYTVGGVANVLIRESDGAVLAVWHDR